MSHNLLIVKPNTREKIGLAAAAMKPEDVDSQGRSYIPASSDVLAASKMLQTGEKETLRLTAPVPEGECEYVCTFPGHYQVMRGQLVVTKNVEEDSESESGTGVASGGCFVGGWRPTSPYARALTPRTQMLICRYLSRCNRMRLPLMLRNCLLIMDRKSKNPPLA